MNVLIILAAYGSLSCSMPPLPPIGCNEVCECEQTPSGLYCHFVTVCPEDDGPD